MSFKNYLNVYEFDSVLPGTGEKVKIKPITTGMMKRMLLYESATDEQGAIEDALDDLLKQCVITPGFEPDKQYLQDRFFLITELRKITKGNLYTFQASCPACKSQSSQTVDLTKLKLTKNKLLDEKKDEHPIAKKITEEVKSPKIKPGLHVKKPEKEIPVVIEVELKVEVPIAQNVVKLNDTISVELELITRGMQKEAFKITNNLKNVTENQKRAETMTVTTAMAIQSIITPDGKEIPLLEDKIFLVNNITQGEVEKIREWFEDHDFGIDFSFDTVCPHCGDKSRREVPMEDFFS